MMKTEKNSQVITHRNLDAEFVIVGGGLSGLCAALAAARKGVKCIIVQDRPVLGGNCSSETRMGIMGAAKNENKETGLLEELQLENIYTNPLFRYTRWDDVMYSAVMREKNITLILNTSVDEVQCENNVITGVTAWNINEYCRYHITGRYFADCSGDGILRLSGAEFRIGREDPAEFGEDLLAEGNDTKTMGSSLLLQLRKTAEHRPFNAPEWAYHFTDEDFEMPEQPGVKAWATNSVRPEVSPEDKSPPKFHSFKRLYPEDNNFWWIEFGGIIDTIADANDIQKELKKIAYGVWEYMKNHPDGRCRNYDLDWIGSLAGKRESCRFVGDLLLNQHHILAGGKFPDVVAYGGWPLDDHDPEAFFSKKCSSVIHFTPSPYGIPFRSLYSKNISNLLFAGRNISCTHIGMSSTRVMGTCALLGQAVGTAVPLLKKYNITPRELYQHHITELQNDLMEDDVMLPGITRPVSPVTMAAETDHEILRNGIERGTENCVELAQGESCVYRWNAPQKISGARIVFDTDLAERNKRMLKLEAESQYRDLPPMLTADYKVEAEVGGQWQTVVEKCGNYQRLCRDGFAPVEATAARLTILRTWGGGKGGVFAFEVR